MIKVCVRASPLLAQRGRSNKRRRFQTDTGAEVEHVLTGFSVLAYPIPLPPSQTVHFSAAEFFRDSPWLNVPSHRKADILVEPLYPRMGLMGGAPESGGKVSKLAALAAARKKKEGEKPAEATPAVATPSADKTLETPAAEAKPSTLSLRERLAANDKPRKQSNGISTLRSLGKGSPAPSPLLKKPTPEPAKLEVPIEPGLEEQAENDQADHKEEPEVNIRAPPSGFASTIVGDSIRPMMTEPSHLHSNTADLIRIYGQDLTEPFDFAGPSPDDVVVNAQSSAKGLAIRRKI